MDFQTPKDRMVKVRIESKPEFKINGSLILHMSMQIIEIAMEHGFESQETYSRAFMKQFGITLGSYGSSSEGKSRLRHSKSGKILSVVK
ncbi:hypothetical protein [Paenibacillus sp. FSL R7-0333]|uniref:hypothetical protein n=1 Tax=Paenibacillus sp. FSL R7-0333 TaxID=1926587 RepID=UPI00096D829D|nr:hypothetical protein BK146_07115 [Paenibacillus sp. FSL R7-0333]